MVRNDHKLILVAIAMCIIVPIVVYLGLQAYLSKEFFSTVLYADGTLIIEESSLDKKGNEEKHGEIVKEYPSFEEDGYIFDRDQHKPYWYKDAQLITSIEVGSEIQPENLAFWFSDLYYVNTINVSKIDASQVESMAYLFNEIGYYADELTIKGIDSWDTSNVTDMQYMFRAAGANAKKFELKGGLDDWDTSKVRITVYMFCDAGKQADGQRPLPAAVCHHTGIRQPRAVRPDGRPEADVVSRVGRLWGKRHAGDSRTQPAGHRGAHEGQPARHHARLPRTEPPVPAGPHRPSDGISGTERQLQPAGVAGHG